MESDTIRSPCVGLVNLSCIGQSLLAENHRKKQAPVFLLPMQLESGVNFSRLANDFRHLCNLSTSTSTWFSIITQIGLSYYLTLNFFAFDLKAVTTKQNWPFESRTPRLDLNLICKCRYNRAVFFTLLPGHQAWSTEKKKDLNWNLQMMCLSIYYCWSISVSRFFFSFESSRYTWLVEKICTSDRWCASTCI